jgi:glycosyltransferase involved in cell wall biosynthesis
MKTICLVMMVKNEAAVIRRGLDSVKGIISSWLICDTGSSDDTQGIISEALKGVPGDLHKVPWLDFGQNRTLCLRLARGRADYHLVLDADMTLNIRSEFRHKLEADAYLIKFEGDVEYHLPLLVSDRHEWKYIGVTHEYLRSETAARAQKLGEISVTHHCDGGSRATKFERDIQLLKRGLKDEPDNTRYMFYLAQAYRDTGAWALAKEWYERRAVLGGWEEETWCAKYEAARMRHRLGEPWPCVLEAYLSAFQFRPTRLEPLLHVARHYRENQQYALGWLFARPVIETPYPDDILFVERSVYDYELPMEYAICCYWLGQHDEAIRINDMIIARAGVPENFLETARKNRQFSVDSLASVGKLPPALQP